MVKKITLAALAALTLSLPGVQAKLGMSSSMATLGKTVAHTLTLGHAYQSKATKAVTLVSKSLNKQVTRLARLALKPNESKLGKAARYARNLAVAGLPVAADQYLNNGQYTKHVVDAAKNFDYKNPNAYTSAGIAVKNAAIVAGTGISNGVTSAATTLGNGLSTAKNAVVNFDYSGTATTVKNFVVNNSAQAVEIAKAHPYMTAAAVATPVLAYGAYKLAPKVKALLVKKATSKPATPAKKQDAGKLKAALKFAAKKAALGTTYVVASGIDSIPTQLVLTGILKTAQYIQSKTPDSINKKFATIFAKLPTCEKAYIKPLLYIVTMACLYPLVVNAALAQFGLTMPSIMAYIPAHIAAWIPSWLQYGGAIGVITSGLGSAFEHCRTLCGYPSIAAEITAIEAANMCHVLNPVCEVNGTEAAYNNAELFGKVMIKILGAS